MGAFRLALALASLGALRLVLALAAAVVAVVWLASDVINSTSGAFGLVYVAGRVAVRTSGGSVCGSLVGEGEGIDGTGGACFGLWHWAR